MKHIIKRKPPYWWAITYSILLVGFTSFVLLKVFVIQSTQIADIKDSGIYLQEDKDNPHTEGQEQVNGNLETHNDRDEQATQQDTSITSDDNSTQEIAEVTDYSYKDDNINITINEKQIGETKVYIVDIQLSNVKYLKTALADNAYGRNIKEKTSEMAEQNNAILAINGDYYGFRDYGYVLRNGVLYRSNYGEATDEAFVVYEDGNCKVVTEGDETAESLLGNGAVQILSFGPGLIEDDIIAVSQNEEVDQAKRSNPRTAIGMVDPLHYVIVVSDGRTNESKGLTLYELAEVMKDSGCSEAYNLDGGGSSTLWFNGKVINNPTDGRKLGEREVSDIVYIGY